MWITDNQQTTVKHFFRDFMASAHSNFFQGQMDMGLTYGLTIPVKTWFKIPKKIEKVY
jgi:hypothetical protein